MHLDLNPEHPAEGSGAGTVCEEAGGPGRPCRQAPRALDRPAEAARLGGTRGSPAAATVCPLGVSAQREGGAEGRPLPDLIRSRSLTRIWVTPGSVWVHHGKFISRPAQRSGPRTHAATERGKCDGCHRTEPSGGLGLSHPYLNTESTPVTLPLCAPHSGCAGP